MRAMERIEPGTRVAGPENIDLPRGYRIEPVAVDLNYVTSLSWDLDGNLLISNDPYEGVKVVSGKLVLPNRPGLGLIKVAPGG